MNTIDYLVIGHVTRDLVPDGTTVGGTVSYSGRIAQALGCRTAIITSAAADDDYHETLSGIAIHQIDAESTSTFENIYTPAGRRQVIHAVANPIKTADIPHDWLRPGIVHLGPLTNEVEPGMITQFSNSLVGLTPQGWLRRWHEDGVVFAGEWDYAQQVLPLAAAVVLSEEDLIDDAMLVQYRQWSKLLVLTLGWGGCTVFVGDETRQIPAPVVEEVEPTGAGDIFAAAYFVRLRQTGGNPWEAARFANEVASLSVTQIGLDAKIKLIKEQTKLGL